VFAAVFKTVVGS